MFVSNRKSGLGRTAAGGLLFDPEIRRAAAHAAPPLARLGLGVGKRMARKRAELRFQQAGRTLTTLGALVSSYGPQIAQQLGLVEPPKRRRVAPAVATAAVVGAGAIYLAQQPQQRRKLTRLIVH
jgi:hypothetical protein